jgi:flagellar biosynthesis component FlhA
MESYNILNVIKGNGMKSRIVFLGVTVVFFVIYFQIFRYLWDFLLPWNLYTDIIALFIIIFVNIPLSVFSADKIIKIIRSDKFSE